MRKSAAATPDPALVQQLLDRIAALEAGLGDLARDTGAAMQGHGAWLADLQQGVGDIRTGHGQQLDDLANWMGSAVLTLGSLSTSPVLPSPELQRAGPAAQLVDPVAELTHQMRVWTVARWLEHDPVGRDTPITVVLPTRDRVEHLRDAVASVLAQRHAHLELVIVDDGSTDDTAGFLATLDDPRVRVLRTEGIAEAAARNLALDAATGAIVAYLDDDNRMAPGWLHAVAWAFDRWPDTELLYGARIIEDAAARDSRPSGSLPTMEFVPWDRRRLELANYVDMNTIAHRADLTGARFDETLHSSIDWELVLRLTARRDPFELPAIACYYGTYAPHRVCDRPDRLDHNKRVRSRIHRHRPLRVLAHNAMFPLLSESYIREESLSLEANGAVLAFDSTLVPVSPVPIEQTVTHDLLAAVADFGPDLVVVHWSSHAIGQLAALERAGRPFAVRGHSFDSDPAAFERLRDHPLCIGVWAYPHHAAASEGLHPFVPIFHTHASMPTPAPPEDRDLVVSLSAGLPKKDWPVLLAAMTALDDLPRHIILGRSNGLESVPEEVEALAAATARPPIVEVNLPRDQVFERLARTSVLLYTVEPGQRLGMPMSIIEAMRAGCCIVHPDHDDLRGVVGPGYRGYRTVEDIVEHVREITAGGPAIEAERAANVAWAIERFCDPALGTRYHQELADALEDWRYRNG